MLAFLGWIRGQMFWMCMSLRSIWELGGLGKLLRARRGLPSDDLYRVGQVFRLKILSQGDDSSVAKAMDVRIRKIITQTFSAAMVVDIESEQRSQTGNRMAFLKLYDRRCAQGMRRPNTWTGMLRLWEKDVSSRSCERPSQRNPYLSEYKSR